MTREKEGENVSRPRSARAVALRSSALFAVAALTLVVPMPTATAAADGDDAPAVRWSVAPADASGEDGRFSIQHEVEPGETVTDHITVQNLGEEEQTFTLLAADGFTTRNGRFDMLASDAKSVDAGTWIALPEEVTVAGGDSVVVPFDIRVPERAEPGDHPAGIAASVVTKRSATDGTSLGVESRVGVKVITRVAGALTPALTVDDVDTDYHPSWNPLTPGEATVTFTVTNTGNTRLAVTGHARAGTGEASFPTPDQPIGDLLPGDTRQVSVLIGGVIPLFYAPGQLVITPQAAALEGPPPPVEPVAVDFAVAAVPWSQLLVLVAAAIVVLALTGSRRRAERRLQAQLRSAREEGRRSALVDDRVRTGSTR